MKQKKDISLELKNELNLIRDTYIAVIENRTRPFTVDDIRNGIKPYQIVGLSEVPDLLSDSDEDIEKFVDEWFDKVFNFDGKPRTPLTPEQQSLIIDELDRATIEAILIHRQRDAAQSRGKNDLNEFIEYQLRALYDLYEENPPTSTNGKRRTYGDKKYTQNKLFYMVYDKLRLRPYNAVN